MFNVKMSKKTGLITITVLILVAIIILIFGICASNKKKADNEAESVQPTIAEYINKLLSADEIDFDYFSKIKLTEVREIHGGQQPASGNVVWWEEMFDQNWLNKFNDDYNLNLPEVDWKSYSLIAAYGKKIVKIRSYHQPDVWGEQNNNVAVMTFSEDYNDRTIFLYLVSKETPEYPVFVSSSFSSECFVMEGGEEVFVGQFYIDFWEYEE